MNRFEKEAYQKGCRIIAGVDEAGRGPLAGPVVAAAVILPPGYENNNVKDSKRVPENHREKLYEILQEDALSFAIGVVEACVIDEINILQATLLAMKEAVENLQLVPDIIFVDGNKRIPVGHTQRTIVNGDNLSISIAAASIIAKVSRDRIMEMYHRQFPQYNFARNKGYGTSEHREAIHRYGVCKIHRKSFQLKKTRPANIEFDFSQDV
ncbi:MAG: ribonuclease HII [Syntrophales bacterium]|jgi:ribonuclease HII